MRTERKLRPKRGINCSGCSKPMTFQAGPGHAKVLIDQDAIPHSHPVLTSHVRQLKDDLALLSTFVHEEYHWYEAAHLQETAAVIAELKTAYPHVPVGGQDGDSDEKSSYLHIIVCYGEYQEMKALVGAERALKVMQFWATDHYRSIWCSIMKQTSDLSSNDTVYSRRSEPLSTGHSANAGSDGATARPLAVVSRPRRPSSAWICS